MSKMAGKKIYSISDFSCIDKNFTPIPEESPFLPGAIILMNKPLEWTSFDVVRYVRNRLKIKKVGHAGTLDPLAAGLLICCCGRATKTISQLQDQSKTYLATIRFGYSTPSYDAATEADHSAGWEHIRAEEIEKVLQEKFTGTIMQKPPVYSALKKDGKRLYTYARKGVEVEIEPRPVVIHNITIKEISLPYLTLEVVCGKGTYIRSLAHDLGLELNSRAHLSALVRTHSGGFSVQDAYSPEEFSTFINDMNHD